MKAPALSRCPFCKAVGVKQYDPLYLDAQPVDVPYCGVCGKNLPAPPPPTRIVPFPEPAA